MGDPLRRLPQALRGDGRSQPAPGRGRPWALAYGGDHLYYAWYDGATWQSEVADGAPGVGQYASLALDDAGQPHIAYYDGVASDLRYARRDANGWHVQVVAADGAVGLHASLALDAAGWPHIAFYDDTAGAVRVALLGDAGWALETVEGVGGVVRDISLALDGEAATASATAGWTIKRYATLAGSTAHGRLSRW